MSDKIENSAARSKKKIFDDEIQQNLTKDM